MGKATEKIIKKCKAHGIEININDRELCTILERFDDMCEIRPMSDGGVRVAYNFGAVSKDLIIHKDGKYSYSEGIGFM